MRSPGTWRLWLMSLKKQVPTANAVVPYIASLLPSTFKGSVCQHTERMSPVIMRVFTSKFIAGYIYRPTLKFVGQI
jgi:hypothetical protein